jgi:prevent-host-death family protein
MPKIKPVSDLRNYNDVLRDVAVGEPVFLTKNGRGRYALIDMIDYEKTQAVLKLMAQIAVGEKAGRENGWLSIEDVEKSLAV